MTLTTRTLERRQFLRGAAMTAGAVAALPALRGLSLLGLNGRVYAQPGSGSYGPLKPTPDLRDGVKRIALPRGFKYRSFSHAGELMFDGNLVPLAHDGMAVFNMPDARFRLVRNHEDRNAPNNGSAAVDGNAYDIRGGANYDTRTDQTVGVPLPVEWVSIATPDPPGQGSNDVYNQGFAGGAAIFTRLEGCWYGNGAIYFDATDERRRRRRRTDLGIPAAR